MNDDMRGKSHVVVQRPTDTWARTVGDPRPAAIPKPDFDCPNCSQALAPMEVDVENEYLIGGKGVGVYLHCDGCGFNTEIGARIL